MRSGWNVAFVLCVLPLASCGVDWPSREMDASTDMSDVSTVVDSSVRTDADIPSARPQPTGKDAGRPMETTQGKSSVPNVGVIGTLGPRRGAGQLTVYADGFETFGNACAGELCATGGVEP
jgi:hypothetical protein